MYFLKNILLMTELNFDQGSHFFLYFYLLVVASVVINHIIYDYNNL